jgi:RNA polymerase sigma factor (sigma-70 family)
MLTRQNIDLTLLKEARQGNEKAFTQFFDYYSKQVYRYIYSIVRNKLDAEDLMMLTFEKAFASINKYAPLFEFRMWLMKIARNVALDFIRYHGRRYFQIIEIDKLSEFIETGKLYFLESVIDNPEDLLIHKQSGEIFEKSFNQLDRKYQDVIRLRFYEDYSYTGISEELHLPLNTICGHVSRARKTLEKIFTKNCA